MPDPRVAHGLTYQVCEHGTLTLTFLDDAGAVFGVAHVPAEGAEQLLDFLVDTYFSDDDDEIGEVAGHA